MTIPIPFRGLNFSATRLRGTYCPSILRRWRQSSSQATANGIKLRPYQEEAIQAVLKSVQDGKHRLGLSLATGAGKTVIFSQLIGRMQPSRPEATKTLILVHRRELVEQAARHCRNAYPDKSVEVEMGKLQASGAADITVASIMSLIRSDRLSKYDPKKYKLILVDEAHHIVASGYLQALEHFGLIKKPSSATQEGVADAGNLHSAQTPALVGVSATLSRFDGLSLGHVIDEVVYHKDYIDLIDENWLSDVVFSTIKSGADLSKVAAKSGGDFLPGSLSEAVNKEYINETTVRSWLAKTDGRKSTLGFCVDVAHVEALTAKFRELGVDARFVTGATPSGSRSQLVEQFRNCEYPVLLNVGVFTEGTDIPNIDCVLLARPTKSRNLLVQMIGRGMRLSPGKGNCHVIDMVSTLQTGIVTVPTLFGLDPTVLLDKAEMSDIKQKEEAPPESLEYVDGKLPKHVADRLRKADPSVTFRDYDSVADLISDTTGNDHVRRLSMNAWVPVGPDSEGHDRHILSGIDKSYLTIKRFGEDEPGRAPFQVSENYTMTEQMRGCQKKRVYVRPRTIAKCQTFEDAVHAADTFANKASNFPRNLRDRQQAWRSKPATESQVELLKKLLPAESELDPTEYTTGACMEMITKMRFGAKGRFNEIAADRAREGKAQKRVERTRKRETVRVGPLRQESFGS